MQSASSSSIQQIIRQPRVVKLLLPLVVVLLGGSGGIYAFVPRTTTISSPFAARGLQSQHSLSSNNFYSDFDDFVGDDSSSPSSFFDLAERLPDHSACRTRRFLLGQDLIIESYVGSMGFEEVTDWEYYYPEEDGGDDRQVVQPNPFDKATPKRTRTSSGSLVRIFRAEFIGALGGQLRAQGLDNRCWIKEYSGGPLALKLAESEFAAAAQLQSQILFPKDRDYQAGAWTAVAQSRQSTKTRQDNANLSALLQELQQSRPSSSTSLSTVAILGEVNWAEALEEDENWDPNEFYRALSVRPPTSDAIWIVYEYTGLATVQAYTERPPAIRRQRLPPQRGFFGNPVPPDPLPAFGDRSRYVRQGIVRQAVAALAQVHESGLLHRSIGRSSLVLSSTTNDKTEAVSVYQTRPAVLRVKLADLGFSGSYERSTVEDPEFISRARTFGLTFSKGENSILTANFGIAEDWHALGFCVLGLILTALAELPDEPPAKFAMPPTDEDTLQRLWGEIFGKDMEQFREYLADEETIWAKLVHLLDETAGWDFLETLLLARERVAQDTQATQLLSVRTLLDHPFLAADK